MPGKDANVFETDIRTLAYLKKEEDIVNILNQWIKKDWHTRAPMSKWLTPNEAQGNPPKPIANETNTINVLESSMNVIMSINMHWAMKPIMQNILRTNV